MKGDLHFGEITAIAAVCERLGEHLYCNINGKTRCGVCGTVRIVGGEAHYMYYLYLRGLVEDGPGAGGGGE